MRDMLACRRAEELLSDDLDGTLDGVLGADLLAHLDSCERCRELRAAVAEVMEVLRSAPAREPAADLAERAAAAALARGRAPAPARMKLPGMMGLPPWVLATAAVLALALSTGLVAASGSSKSLGAPGRIAQKVSAAGVYVAEKKDRLVEDFRMLRVVVGTAFEGRLDRMNDRVDDYRRLLERRRRDEQLQRSQEGATEAAPGKGPRPEEPRETPSPAAKARRTSQKLLNPAGNDLVKACERRGASAPAARA